MRSVTPAWSSRVRGSSTALRPRARPIWKQTARTPKRFSMLWRELEDEWNRYAKHLPAWAILTEVLRARHALKHALRRKHGCNPEEAKRIAKILDQAAAEILGK